MNTGHPVLSAPADAGSDYQNTLHVKAPPEAVFQALTTAAGLSAWWTRAVGFGDAGGELEFFFGDSEPLVMHVEEAVPTSVAWTVKECSFLPDWIGTRPTFTIAPHGDGQSVVMFRHIGLTPELECIDMCTRGWNHFIASLGEYVEQGHGNPLGSAGDNARRASKAPQLTDRSEAKR